ncbi:hypothetical protein [Dyella sp.]|uniref:hypothetical protein n=1 Tax=Dyella sp. TaxID=1869338 RepID=UPI002ED4A68A
MSIFKNMAKVREAKTRVVLARTEAAEPTAALLARGERFPLTTVGAAAGAGFVLGRLNIHPLRVPGLGSLLSGTVAEIVAQATRMIVDFVEQERGSNAADGNASSDEP